MKKEAKLTKDLSELASTFPLKTIERSKKIASGKKIMFSTSLTFFLIPKDLNKIIPSD